MMVFVRAAWPLKLWAVEQMTFLHHFNYARYVLPEDNAASPT